MATIYWNSLAFRMCSIMHALHTFHLRQSNGSDVINETLDFNVGRAVDVLHDPVEF